MVRPSTLDGYRSKAFRRIIPMLGGYKLDALRPEHVEGWRKDLLTEALALATILRCFHVLSRLGTAAAVSLPEPRIARPGP
ncbi:site-specific integrase, partial [Frankia sp. CNm7]|nr:site-specific integrase [Frankia nepalensis]